MRKFAIFVSILLCQLLWGQNALKEIKIERDLSSEDALYDNLQLFFKRQSNKNDSELDSSLYIQTIEHAGLLSCVKFARVLYPFATNIEAECFNRYYKPISDVLIKRMLGIFSSQYGLLDITPNIERTVNKFVPILHLSRSATTQLVYQYIISGLSNGDMIVEPKTDYEKFNKESLTYGLEYLLASDACTQNDLVDWMPKQIYDVFYSFDLFDKEHPLLGLLQIFKDGVATNNDVEDLAMLYCCSDLLFSKLGINSPGYKLVKNGGYTYGDLIDMTIRLHRELGFLTEQNAKEITSSYWISTCADKRDAVFNELLVFNDHLDDIGAEYYNRSPFDFWNKYRKDKDYMKYVELNLLYAYYCCNISVKSPNPAASISDMLEVLPYSTSSINTIYELCLLAKEYTKIKESSISLNIFESLCNTAIITGAATLLPDLAGLYQTKGNEKDMRSALQLAEEFLSHYEDAIDLESLEYYRADLAMLYSTLGNNDMVAKYINDDAITSPDLSYDARLAISIKQCYANTGIKNLTSAKRELAQARYLGKGYETDIQALEYNLGFIENFDNLQTYVKDTPIPSSLLDDALQLHVIDILATCLVGLIEQNDPRKDEVLNVIEDYLAETILNTVLSIDPNNRMNYVESKLQSLQSISDYLFKTEADLNGIGGLLFDVSLLKKGSVQNADRRDNVRMNNPDSFLSRLISELRDNESLYVEFLEKGTPVDSLTYLSKTIDVTRYFIEQYKTATQDNTMSIKWADVQQSLRPNEIAVEFLKLSNSDGEARYYAVILKNTCAPFYLPICGEDEMKLMYYSPDCYDNQDYSRIIWDKILSASNASSGSTIFFAPDGEINHMAIEYLLYKDNLRVCDIYNCYRVSSLKELALDKELPLLNADIFGDIKYNSNLYADLKHSKNEIDSISKILRNNGKLSSNDIHFFNGFKATKSNFIRNSSSSNNILHISSHGDYGVTTEGTNSMASCGILFDNSEILSAEEISYLNLSNTNLAVIASCNSGEGRLSFDGVYGLQRGLKLAGVQSLMMSLWEVEDEFALIFMPTFYQNLTKYNLSSSSIRSRHSAFFNALKQVRDKYNSANASWWAPFILID